MYIAGFFPAHYIVARHTDRHVHVECTCTRVYMYSLQVKTLHTLYMFLYMFLYIHLYISTIFNLCTHAKVIVVGLHIGWLVVQECIVLIGLHVL